MTIFNYTLEVDPNIWKYTSFYLNVFEVDQESKIVKKIIDSEELGRDAAGVQHLKSKFNAANQLAFSVDKIQHSIEVCLFDPNLPHTNVAMRTLYDANTKKWYSMFVCNNKPKKVVPMEGTVSVVIRDGNHDAVINHLMKTSGQPPSVVNTLSIG